MAYGDQNAGPGFRQAHKCYGIKLVNEDRKQRFKKKNMYRFTSTQTDYI
jgi:hypothetical protein